MNEATLSTPVAVAIIAIFMNISATGLAVMVTIALAVVALSPVLLVYLLIKDLRNRTSW